MRESLKREINRNGRKDGKNKKGKTKFGFGPRSLRSRAKSSDRDSSSILKESCRDQFREDKENKA